ncbi:Molybdopterin binding protein [Choiromyces venosus 120613-1]|uniref:Molybdopterin binding protein n=1 Tax=Choiromyces venosus 120613-1 TaxID=1336337 RepID=A0A3N4K6D7_9PEZI|nr:Molybdopterin binding protein [Choiromyces venosus 120613-1]
MTTSQNTRLDKPIRTSACLIIGDEVLNGKTVDTNSSYFAKFCFDLGVEMKRVEVIADDEGEIIEAVRRMSTNYDFVVTSGGIGPTHDDITYSSIAKAFDLPLTLHDGTWARMCKLSKSSKTNPPFDWETPSPMLTAKQRMALLPTGPNVQNVYISPDLWVPICIVGNVHILPGIPRIFEQLLQGLRPRLNVDSQNKQTRVIISTPMKESEIAGFLTNLQEKVKERGVKVGSYPRWGKIRNTVTLTGADKDYIESLVDEVEKGVRGLRVSVEGEDDAQEKPEEVTGVQATTKDGVKT